MELCDLNLETYITRKWSPHLYETVPFFAKIDTSPASVKVSQIKEMMENIVEGLAFIHENRLVHRDLKPRNGMSS